LYSKGFLKGGFFIVCTSAVFAEILRKFWVREGRRALYGGWDTAYYYGEGGGLIITTESIIFGI
jgi:hypothetical protein